MTTIAERTDTSGTPGTSTAHGSHPADALVRAARLEALLGDPYDQANPHGLQALFAADARREPPAETEALLDAHHVGAEFVPAAQGGLLTRADHLVRALRPVFRRDLALGFGHGITSLFAAGVVWAAGSEHQRRYVAARLLDGGRATTLHHELAHANAILRHEFTARPGSTPGSYLLGGRKDVIINASRADLQIVYARTDPARGPRSHSVLLLDPARHQPHHAQHLPRVDIPGMRGALFSGLEFHDCPVPAGALVGPAGAGVALALRTFQVNRSLVCGAVTAAADTVLRSAVRAATEGRGGRPVARRWHKPLAGVFADLLACDSMSTVALRALSLLPAGAHVFAAATKYVVPDLLRENFEELAPVLGTHGYDHSSPEYGALGKLARDLPIAGFGHAGRASCQAALVPQLRNLAERSWFAEPEPPSALFRSGAPLPDLDYQLLGIAGGGDFMAASLVGSASRLAAAHGAGGHIAALAVLAEEFVGELRTLQEQCRRLPTSGAALADSAVAVLSDRYCHLVGAAAVLGVWEGQDGSDPFLANPAWAVLALTRIGGQLGIPMPELPEGCQEQVLAELVRRYRDGRSYDLDATAPTP
ncbi:acyl-CoA dehydrogenase [Streptomyces sp. NPDC058657]|uniref:acyl-CoA dehydrogenase n=1 Tax=unclassified Streptomyces TaxID=2593676 RepID=UPI003648D86F